MFLLNSIKRLTVGVVVLSQCQFFECGLALTICLNGCGLSTFDWMCELSLIPYFHSYVYLRLYNGLRSL